MNFKPDMVEEILSGKKTVTRRRLYDYKNRLVRYKVGRVYAVQPGRSQPHVAHILIWSIEYKPLGTLTDAEARDEGFYHETAFWQYWRRLYGDYDYNEEVAVISFSLADRCEKCEGTVKYNEEEIPNGRHHG